ncbi:MAG: hypothetical protein IKH57_05510 [Clostridia bacterium]|nr:hypothetical protein [Clostridia bacterium]
MPFSYENYHIMDKAAAFDISIDELPMLNPDFKRYIKILTRTASTVQLI